MAERVGLRRVCIVAAIAALAGCSSGPDRTGEAAGRPVPVGTVDYANVLRPLLARECVTCHNADAAIVDPLIDDLSTYETTRAIAPRILDSIAAKRMPPTRPLGEADVRTVREWIDAGMPESVPQH